MRSNLVRATVGWGEVFALVHFYWAAGCEVGMDGEAADTLVAQLYIAFIAVLGLAGAAVAGGLMRRRSGMLVLLARAGAGALLIGVAVGVARWAVEGGLEDDGASGVVTTLYFLLGGVLFWSLGRGGDESRTRPGS